MKRAITSLVLAFTFFVCGNVLAADNAAVVGKWDMELNFQGQAVTITLTINETAAGLGGTWGSPQGTTDLSEVSFDGETLKFTRIGRTGESVQTSMKLENGMLNGSLTTPGGDMPLTAKKSA